MPGADSVLVTQEYTRLVLDGTPAAVGRALVERGLLDHRAFRGSVLRVCLTVAKYTCKYLNYYSRMLVNYR